MLQKKSTIACWSFGLAPEQEKILRDFLGKECTLVSWPTEHIPSLYHMEKDNPCLLWLSAEGRHILENLPQGSARHLELLPKALLLDQSYSLKDFESACDSGISEIVRPPFTQKRVLELLRQAVETQSVHHDMYCMSREILLERELLERKNELLEFLVKFLTSTTESLDLDCILRNAAEGLRLLLPVRSLHAAIWERDETTSPTVALLISDSEDTRTHEQWRETLLEHVAGAVGDDFAVTEVHTLALDAHGKEETSANSTDGPLLVLPLVSGTEHFGVILLLAEMERPLGRDQAMVLDSAMRQLSLSIKNARRFKQMQLHADYDALTGIHSRRHFEIKFEEEMCKFERYGQSLFLLMIDVDHFKRINDTHGHYTGDRVLREVGSLIAGTIRSTDYCARYGGEEFAVLLPHSSTKRTLLLAERLRKAIARHSFRMEGEERLSITVSVGFAGVVPGIRKSGQALLVEADAALYAAKTAGRNCTRDSVVTLMPALSIVG